MCTLSYVSDNNNNHHNKTFSCIVSGSVFDLFLNLSNDYQQTGYGGMTEMTKMVDTEVMCSATVGAGLLYLKPYSC